MIDLEQGLPFKDKSFDTVVAFDVLEHLENIYKAFDGLYPVAKGYVFIGLPNMYEWRFRLLFVLRRKLSGKYGLPPEAPKDRHRWLFSLDEARECLRR